MEIAPKVNEKILLIIERKKKIFINCTNCTKRAIKVWKHKGKGILVLSTWQRYNDSIQSYLVYSSKTLYYSRKETYQT